MQAFFKWIAGPVWLLYSFRARSAQRATLLWTLAVAVDKRVSLVPFLEALADEAGGGWRFKLRGLADLLHAGTSIPAALESVPGILPMDTLVLIRAGADAGQLGPALRSAAARWSRSSEPGLPGGGSALYLCAIGFVMLYVVGFLMYWIIPKFKAIFEGFDLELPLPTQAVIGFSNFWVAYWYLAMPLVVVSILLSVGIGVELFAWSISGPSASRGIARWLPRLRAPLVLRCLALAVAGDRPLLTGLSAIALRHNDVALRGRVAQVSAEVAAGGDCWSSLRAAGLLRTGETALLEAAQRTGNLDWALRGLADTIERRVEHRARMVIEFLRPVGIITAGGVVGYFVVAMFLPLIELITRLS